MKYRHVPIFCLTAMLGMSAALAQQAAATPATGSSSPVAFVYVDSYYSGMNESEIFGFAANSAGGLTALPQSPFSGSLTNMAVNGKYLFGGSNTESDIKTFSIAANGSVKYILTTSAGLSCEVPGLVSLDHTGSDLYAAIGNDCDGVNYAFETFSVQKSTGKLTYTGTTAEGVDSGPLSLLGNNTYAYATYCNAGYDAYDTFAGYRRQSNGALTNAAITAPLPSTGNSGSVYCRALIASDPTNHLAVYMLRFNTSTWDVVGNGIAIYTADGNGNLTTTSTLANMPETAVGYVGALAMSPSGELLAVGGTGGVQVFHFNGAKPITPYKVLKTKPVAQSSYPVMYWDRANHLYFISAGSQKLYVYTITPTHVSQAPGSPYTIREPAALIVQSLTK